MDEAFRRPAGARRLWTPFAAASLIVSGAIAGWPASLTEARAQTPQSAFAPALQAQRASPAFSPAPPREEDRTHAHQASFGQSESASLVDAQLYVRNALLRAQARSPQARGAIQAVNFSDGNIALAISSGSEIAAPLKDLNLTYEFDSEGARSLSFVDVGGRGRSFAIKFGDDVSSDAVKTVEADLALLIGAARSFARPSALTTGARGPSPSAPVAAAPVRRIAIALLSACPANPNPVFGDNIYSKCDAQERAKLAAWIGEEFDARHIQTRVENADAPEKGADGAMRVTITLVQDMDDRGIGGFMSQTAPSLAFAAKYEISDAAGAVKGAARVRHQAPEGDRDGAERQFAAKIAGSVADKLAQIDNPRADPISPWPPGAISAQY